MKEKFCAIKNALSKKNKSRYGILLSVVALIEVLMILLVSTYSWVETISSIEITNSAGQVDDYTFTNALVGTGEGFSGQPIDLAKYFRASGNVHLASASSSDGLNFFFPQLAKTGSTKNNYRKGNINDKNTNYISFSFKVQAVGTNANFYFEQVPTFKIGDTVVSNNEIRIALTVADADGSNPVTKVYSNTEAREQVVASISGDPLIQSSQIYAFGDFDNKDDEEANILFSVRKGEENAKLVTLTAWLQDPSKSTEYDGKTLTCNNFRIVTAVKNTTINFVDRTSAFNKADATSSTWNWVGNDKAIMWIKTSQGAFKMQKVETSDPGAAPTWTITLPTDNLGSSNDDFYFYRTAKTVTSNPQENHYNFWKTKLSETSAAEIPTYKAYGNLKPGSDKEGYGTWGSVCEIMVTRDEEASPVLPTPSDPNTATQITVKTNNNASEVPMNYNNGYWRVFIPNDNNSADLTISFLGNTINAIKRDKSESGSKFHVTSNTTGYWEPASVVEVKVATGYEGMGKVSVTGGPVDATRVKVTKGTPVDIIATPNLIPNTNDYAFEGWYYDDECTKPLSSNSTESFTPVEKSKTYTLYARFQYNVRLTAITDDVEEDNTGGSVQINNGTAGAKASLYVKKGGSVTLKAVQTPKQAEDYTFMGWIDSENQVVYPADKTTIEITDLQEPINYFAVYKIKTYTLEAYALKGGSAEFWLDDTLKKSGAHITITATNKQSVVYKAVPDESSGYEFVGWYEDEACSKLKTEELKFTANKNTAPKTYYAKFQLKKYNRTAHAVTNGTVDSAKGGTVQVKTDLATSAAGAKATEKITHGNIATLVAKANDGYKFVGWYDEPSGGTRISTASTYTEENAIAGDKTYYAIFKQEFSVSLTARTDGFPSSTGGNVQAGSNPVGATSFATVLYGDDITIKAIVSSAKYSFIGWYDSSNTGQGNEATKTLSNVTGNISLFADFKVKTFTIKAIAVSEGTEGSAGGTVEFTSPVASSGATATVTVNYDGSATFKATVNEKNDGYEFKGWFNNVAMTGTPYKTDLEFELTNIVDSTVKTYYAKFDLKQYTVSAYSITTGTATSGGGTVVQVINGTEQTASDIVNINNVKHGSQITLRAKPASGATFLGWYNAETGGKQLADENTTDLVLTVTDKTQVYARFKVSGKTIYFKPNDGWKASSARFAAYMWTGSGGSGSERWYDLTDEDGDGTYCFTSTNSWSNIVFARMNPSTTDNNFNKDVRWSQTGDLEVPSGDNPCYTITDGPDNGNNSTGEWGTYKPIEYVSVNLGAVSIDVNGRTQSDGDKFTGGSITVGSNTYTSAQVLKLDKDSSFTATAKGKGNYQFKGWYDNAECTGDPLSTDTLSTTLSENKTYYAKFVEQTTVEQTTITFEDNTTNYWVSGAGKVYLYDTNTNTVYTSNENGYSDHKATFTVPSSVKNITFYRYAGDYENSELWSTISAGNRGSSTTYRVTGDFGSISGSWS